MGERETSGSEFSGIAGGIGAGRPTTRRQSRGPIFIHDRSLEVETKLSIAATQPLPNLASIFDTTIINPSASIMIYLNLTLFRVTTTGVRAAMSYASGWRWRKRKYMGVSYFPFIYFVQHCRGDSLSVFR